MDQKANIPSVEAAVRALAEHVQEVRNGVQNTVTRQNELSGRIDSISERLQAARDRMEMVTAQLDQGNRETANQTEALKRSVDETQKRVAQMGNFLEHSCVDSQRIDKGLEDLRESVFNNSVAIDHLREDCQHEADNQRTLSGQTADIAAYQRHAESRDQTIAQCQTQMAAQADRIKEGELQLRRIREEVAAMASQSIPRMDESNVPNRGPELAVRLSQLEEGLRAQQRVVKQMQKDSVHDAKEVKQYLDQIHDLVTDTLQAAEPSSPERARVESTRLTKVARKGDLRIEVEDTEFCRVGEIVLVGGQEARTVLGKSSLIFKVPLDGEYPEGTAVRTLRENEFLQVDGENVYVYEQMQEGTTHMVCGVDLTYRASPEWAEERDDVQDQVYSDDLDQRVQRAIEARFGVSRPVVSGAGGPMVPPWTASHAHEWSTSNGQQRVPPLPSFGKKEEADDAPDLGTPLDTRVKQEDDIKFESLDDYFCKGMDSSGPAWDKLLREMEQNSLVDVGTMNYREGVREEKWGMLDLKSVQFPKPTTQSVKRATLLQYFEVDFIRAMGIISPAAATYGKAVIAGVHRDLPIYRKRDTSTTNRDWTQRTVEELWHTRAEAAVNLALQHAGISAECMEMARMLRQVPPVRLILMTAYHRLLPYQSREEEELQQYVKEPLVGDQGAVSTFQKLQAWKSAGRRLRQMGGMLPGVSALMTAFDKILAAFNVHNQRGNWFYQTERNLLPMVDISPGQAARFFHTVEVNLNQVTTTASLHTKLKAKPKPKAKASGPAGGCLSCEVRGSSA